MAGPPECEAHLPVQSDVATGLAETFVLLDNSAIAGQGSLLFTDPREIVTATTLAEVEQALRRIDDGLARGFHAAGFFAYELGYALEPRLTPRMPPDRTVPLIWIGLYAPPQSLDSAGVETWLAARTSRDYSFTDVHLAWDEAAYLSRFDEVKRNIVAGDIYQLNLTFKARFRLTGSPLAFYRGMRARQRVAYGGIVDTGHATVLSASPELFISRHGDIIETRPMKGTAPRAPTPAEDKAIGEQLAADIKSRAENLMIVDLMRNDLSRISETGSVEVTDLYTVETYRTLHQLTSGVRARLHPNIGLRDILRAIFPPGSVTGAPKIRAMELISTLESEPRGVYCGAIGYLSPDRQAQLNVAIRTPVVFRDGTGEMGIGSGLVYDSDGRAEYAECKLKMKFLTDPVKPFELIETLLYDGAKGYWLLPQHLARLASSARYFRFSYDEAAVRTALAEAVADRTDERLRVRLLLAETGVITLTLAAQPAPPPGATFAFVVSPTRVSSSDTFLYHKTTRRELYDREWAEAHAATGADEIIYLNERGELAEGSRTNIFIEKDGRLLTPALSAGLLPGTLRSELVTSGRAEEAILTLADLRAAEKVYLGNSVRGLMPARELNTSI